MSSSYREGCNAAKAVRAGIVEPRPVGGKKRQARPIVVECRCIPRALPPRDWRKWGAYADVETAQRAIDQLSRKRSYYEYRIRP